MFPSTSLRERFAQGTFCLGKLIIAAAIPAAGVAIALAGNFRGDRTKLKQAIASLVFADLNIHCCSNFTRIMKIQHKSVP
ncbi:hypothetical protein [Nostoc sp.]|uniref:hypothetical protein n=1 Tax=Nostoc sp. TaxID=1180 RepID=UPI002FF5ABBC